MERDRREVTKVVSMWRWNEVLLHKTSFYFDGIENDVAVWDMLKYSCDISPDRYEKASKSHELKGLPVNLLLEVGKV